MSYGGDGSDSSSSSGCGGDSSDSSSSGGYGGSSGSGSSGGYGGDSSDSSSSGGYGGDSSDSSSSGGYGGDSSDSSSSGGYGGDSSDSSSSGGYGSDSSDSDASSGYSGDDSTSSSNNNDGNYGGIAGTEYSGAASNDETDTTGAIADSLSFTGDSYDVKGFNAEGITGGEPCSYDATKDFSTYSLDDYTQSSYNYDTSAEATETTMNDIENTIDNVVDTVSDWVSQNIVDPIQEAMNQPVQVPEYTSLSDLIAENTPGMTKEEVENGLNNMGDTSKNGIAEKSITADEPDENLAWAAANGIKSVDYSTTQTEPLTATDVWNAAVQVDSDTYSAPKNGILNTLDAGVAKAIDGVKGVTIGKVSAPSLGIAAELEVAEKSIAVSALKGVSKIAGPLNFASTCYDVNKDFNEYEGENLKSAVKADVYSYGAGLFVGGICVLASAPAIVGIALGTGVACAAGWYANSYKAGLSKKSTNL